MHYIGLAYLLFMLKRKATDVYLDNGGVCLKLLHGNSAEG